MEGIRSWGRDGAWVTPLLKEGAMVARRAVSGKHADNQKCE
jgi:hypothetical protein